jgi:hypothetical protein
VRRARWKWDKTKVGAGPSCLLPAHAQSGPQVGEPGRSEHVTREREFRASVG